MNNFVHNGYLSSEKLEKEVSNIFDLELIRKEIKTNFSSRLFYHNTGTGLRGKMRGREGF